jgi:hypothetical protein
MSKLYEKLFGASWGCLAGDDEVKKTASEASSAMVTIKTPIVRGRFQV